MDPVRIRPARWQVVVIITATLLAAGCSSSGTTTSAPHASSSITAGSAGAATGGATLPGAAPAPGTTVAIRTGPDGSYLVDSTGAALYLFALDAGTTSSCEGDCAQAWPPYTAGGALTAGPGATGTLTATSQPGGIKQVTYNGHLLYHFAKDQAPGGISGEGANNVWYLLSPTGDAIKKSS